MNKRTKHALELRHKGLSFIQIGQDLGIGRERAMQIVRKYQQHLKSMEDPFARKIKDLSSLRETTKILNALRGNDLYKGDPEELSKCEPEDFMKIRGLGTKRVAVIARALESMGVIGDAEEWLSG